MTDSGWFLRDDSFEIDDSCPPVTSRRSSKRSPRDRATGVSDPDDGPEDCRTYKFPEEATMWPANHTKQSGNALPTFQDSRIYGLESRGVQSGSWSTTGTGP